MGITMVKSVHWDAIVLLGIALSNDCRLGGGRFDDRRRQLAEALIRGRRAPMSSASIGGRYAESAEGKTPSAVQGWAKATPFAFLSALIAEEKAKEAQLEAMDVLREEGYSHYSSTASEWLEAIAAFSEADVQRLCWTSATSGASIDCERTPAGGWIATYNQPGKDSRYAALWADMRESALRAVEMEGLINPPPTEEELAARAAMLDNW